MRSFVTLSGAMTLVALALSSITASAQSAPAFLPPPAPVVSTVPSNGDVNPYGVLFVPHGIPTDGVLQPGDILVSNFNNNQNLQGTGTTITRVDAHGNTSTFFQGKPGLGLTAALGMVRRGLVLVGNLPTTDGTMATVQPGSLLVIDRNGNLLASLTDPNIINGPWGMAINDGGDEAQIFVSNVLSGNVFRFDVVLSHDGDSAGIVAIVPVATGFNHRLDPAALVLGPSGLVYDVNQDILYVASSADNAIYAIPNAGIRTQSAGTGTVIYQDATHLHGPLDLVMAPNGHMIVANSDGSNVDPNQPSELVEFTLDGKFVTQFSVDPNNGGAFGLGLQHLGDKAERFAAVDDNKNTLSIWTSTVK